MQNQVKLNLKGNTNHTSFTQIGTTINSQEDDETKEVAIVEQEEMESGAEYGDN